LGVVRVIVRVLPGSAAAMEAARDPGATPRVDVDITFANSCEADTEDADKAPVGVAVSRLVSESLMTCIVAVFVTPLDIALTADRAEDMPMIDDKLLSAELRAPEAILPAPPGEVRPAIWFNMIMASSD
jgi:hypothetical protein